MCVFPNPPQKVFAALTHGKLTHKLHKHDPIFFSAPLNANFKFLREGVKTFLGEMSPIRGGGRPSSRQNAKNIQHALKKTFL